MTSIQKEKSKPPVPPKPKYLVIPKPPENIVEKIHDLVQKLDLANDANYIESNNDYEDDFHLRSNSTSSLQQSCQNSGVHIPKKNVGKPLNSRTDSKSVAYKIPELVENNALMQRPLPLPPGERPESVLDLPWFCDVDRKKAEDIVKNGGDGCCLIRPSSKGQSTLALTLWYCGRPYNIPIRKRSDKNYALGTPKPLEQHFASIEDMILNYQHEELVLYSHGIETGRTILRPFINIK